eukprot:SAG31_NODE_23322_length_506_cov_1.393120_1_plen_57_part_10
MVTSAQFSQICADSSHCITTQAAASTTAVSCQKQAQSCLTRINIKEQGKGKGKGKGK